MGTNDLIVQHINNNPDMCTELLQGLTIKVYGKDIICLGKDEELEPANDIYVWGGFSFISSTKLSYNKDTWSEEDQCIYREVRIKYPIYEPETMAIKIK